MKRKKINLFLKMLGFMFVLFSALFIANISGYYESKIRDNVIITEEGIKEFEERVRNGEEIDVTSFLNNERIDYSSKLSNLGDNITLSVESIVVDGMNFVTDILKSLF